MSVYAVVLRSVKDNPGKTATQLAALIPMETTPVDNALVMLVDDNRVTKTGSGAGATYSSTEEQ